MIEVISKEKLEAQIDEFKRIKNELGESLLRIPTQDTFNRYVSYSFLVDTLKTVPGVSEEYYEEALLWELKMRAKQYCEHSISENECYAIEIMIKKIAGMSVFEFVTKSFNK